MANILSISRGFPTSTLISVLKPAAGKTLVAGDLVQKTDEEHVDLASLLNDEEKQVYVIMEGNDTYSGNETSKVVCVSGDFEYTTDKYNTGSFTVDAPLTATAGKYSIKAGTQKSVAQVLAFSLSQGLKVRFKD